MGKGERFMGAECPFGRWKVLQKEGGDSCRTANVLKAQNCMLKTGNNGKFHALFTTLEKGGSWGKGF